MDLENLGGQLKNVESQLSQYDTNLPSEIQSQIQKAYTPALERSLGTTSKMMGDYLGRYFDTTTMGPGMSGTTAIDLSPTQKLGVMGRELGTMAGNLQSSQQFSDYLGGQMNDMYNKALQAAQMGQQNLADKYNRISQQYQLAWQEAEAEKDRALSRSLSGGGGGGYAINPSDYISQQETPNIDKNAIVDYVQKAAQALAKQRQSGASGYALNGQKIGNIDAVHNYLLNSAKQYGVRINPEWLWTQLGNAPKQITGIGGKQISGAYYTPTY